MSTPPHSGSRAARASDEALETVPPGWLMACRVRCPSRPGTATHAADSLSDGPPAQSAAGPARLGNATLVVVAARVIPWCPPRFGCAVVTDQRRLHRSLAQS